MTDKIIVSKSKVTNLFDSIRAKSGSTELMSFDTAKSTVDDIQTGGGVIEVEELPRGGWNGTTVPNSGTVEKVYFNTNLSVDEVVNILSNLEYNMNGTAYMGLSNSTNDKYIQFINSDNFYGILDSISGGFIFANTTFSDLGVDFEGWKSGYIGIIDFNDTAISNQDIFEIGTQNSQLSSLFSTTPFVKGEEPVEGSIYKVKPTGTAVPDSGYVEKVYVNTWLPGKEIVDLFNKLTIADIPNFGKVYPIIANQDVSKSILILPWYNSDGSGGERLDYYLIQYNNELICSTDVHTYSISWKEDINVSELECGYETAFSTAGPELGLEYQNEKLKNLFSITPFAEPKLYIYKNGEFVELSEDGSSDPYQSLIDNTTTTFSLPKGVTYIKPYLFFKNTNLTYVNLTGATSIGAAAFEKCTNLSEILIPATCTVIGDSGDTSGALSSGKTFSGCGAEYIAINGGDNFPTFKGSYIFSNCSKLKRIYINAENFTLPDNFLSGSGDGTGLIWEYTGQKIALGQACFRYSTLGAFENITVTSLNGYNFANCSKLTDLNFVVKCSSSTTIPSYFAQNSQSLKHITLQITSSITGIGSYTFENVVKLEEFNLVDTGSLSLDTSVSSNALISGTIGNYAFYKAGSTRDDITTPLVLNFERSKFNTINQYAFEGLVNTKIIFNEYLKTINQSAFRICSNLSVFLLSVDGGICNPTLSNINAFQGNSNLKVFVDYNSLENILSSTNWAVYKDQIYGTITNTTSLPNTTANGTYDTLWYYDDLCTQLVESTDTIDPNTRYYSKLGPVSVTNIAAINCSINITDDYGNTYTAGDQVTLGTLLHISTTPEYDNTNTPYLLYSIGVNGQMIDNPSSSFDLRMTDNLSLVVFYWDGVNIPLSPIFADNSWEQIKTGIQSRVGYSLGWKVGDTKPVQFADGTVYNIRLIDTSEGRYQYADNSTYTNALFETVELMPDLIPLYNNNSGNTVTTDYWKYSNVYTYLQQKFNDLPQDLQNVIATVNYPIIYQDSTDYTPVYFLADKLKILDYCDLKTHTGRMVEYYAPNTNSLRIKTLNGVASDWWLTPDVYRQSVGSTMSSSSNYIGSTGTVYAGSYLTNKKGISLVFAI